MAYASVAEVKAALGVAPGDTIDDTAITLATDAASAMIDQACNRTFVLDAAATQRVYNIPSGTKRVDIDDLTVLDDPATLTEVEPRIEVPAGQTAQTYRLLPLNPAPGHPFTAVVVADANGFPTGETFSTTAIRVRGRHGWPAVPPEVRQAGLIQAVRLVNRRHSPYGIAGSPEAGSEMRLMSRLDPDVEALIRPYVKRWHVA